MCDKINAREPPITRLPPELLILVFEGLEPEGRTLCIMTRKYWQILISSLWPEHKTNPERLRHWAAKGGHIECLKMLKRWDAKIFIESFTKAVQAGNIGFSNEKRPNKKLWAQLTPTNALNKSLRLAAYGGHIECMKLLRNWGATKFDGALTWAAAGGYIDCMKLLYKWGARHFDEALEDAAYEGHIECMKLAKMWGATDFNTPLYQAARGGHINCMKILKKWGASDFNSSLWRSAEEGHIDCMKLAKKWGATYFNIALQYAAGRGHINCMKLLKEWGATNLNSALESATLVARPDCVKLLKKWIRESPNLQPSNKS